ncbi:MAG: amidohydrolase family protein [Hyphomicrobiaceae bacterium]
MSQNGFTIIRNGRVLDIPGHRANPSDILIEGDTIREVGPPGLAAPEGARTMDASDKALMPGLVNGHMHGHGALAKGLLKESWTLELFLNSSPSIGGNRTLEDKYLCGMLNAVEMIRKGSTACYDLFFEFPVPSVEGISELGRGYREVGVRATIAPMIADMTLYQALPGLMEAIPEEYRAGADRFRLAKPEETLAACRKVFSAWPFPRDTIRPAIAPTIPLHCSDAFMTGCADLAREFDLPLQTHLAESKTQALLGMRKYGRTLTAHIDRLGLIGPLFSAAHAVWCDGDDLDRIAAQGGSVVHNPLSNMRFGSGLAHLRPMVDRRINVGIGTDGVNSSDSLNMFEAARLASMISRIQNPDYTTWLMGEEVLTMATAGSAQALGFGDMIGRLAPGAKADIVFLDLAHIHYVPLGDIVRQIVFTESGAAVDSVMIGGRMVLDHGKLTTIDEAKLRRNVERSVKRLQGANAQNRAFAAKLEDVVGHFCLGLCRSPYHVNRWACEAA